MTLDEAIVHCLEVAEQKEHKSFIDRWSDDDEWSESIKEECRQCAADHRQLAEWLAELKELREQIQKAKSMLLDSSYTLDIMCNKISGTIGCEKCMYYNRETHDCEVRAYIERIRAFAKRGGESESD